MKNDKNVLMLTVAETTKLLRVTDRHIRNWIKDKGLPAATMPGVQRLDAAAVVTWFLDFRLTENGNSGNRAASDPGGEPLETFDEALARKTRAEADLKELQLARERGEVAAIADVERVLASANKSIQTLMLALPSSLAPQLIGLADRGKIFAVIDRAVRATLSNLASIDAVRQTHSAVEDEDE
jgi:excisionase family DNA binding protein